MTPAPQPAARPSDSLHATIARWAADRPDRVAVVGAESRVTWSGLDAGVRSHRDELKRLGIRSTALLLMPQTADALALLAAASAAGLDVIVAADFHGRDGACRLAEELGATCVLTAGAGGTLEVVATLDDATFDDATLDDDTCDGARIEDATATESGPEPLLCPLTSGSTGQPKAVRHTWSSVSAAAVANERYSTASWLIGYPLTLFAGLQVLAQWVTNGGTLVLPPDFSVESARAAVRAHPVTYLNCTPSFLRQLLLGFTPDDWAAAGMDCITLCGEIIDQPLLDAAVAALPDVRIIHIYAAAEVGAAITVRDGLAGFPADKIDGQRLRVDDGQLFVRRGERAMSGYLAQDDATGEWHATGDVVEVTGDRAHFLGRMDDVVNVGGFKVRPALVVGIIREVPGVLDATVSAAKSSVVGNLVKALVYVEPGTDHVATKRAILVHCRDRLPPQALPRLLQLQDGLQLAPSQKLQREVPS